MKYTANLARWGALTVCLGGLATMLSGQNPPAKSDDSSASENVIQLPRVDVDEVPLEQQILPTARPVTSVLGDDRGILEIPRSVTSVNKAWMEDRHVHDAMDFGQFSPGVYSSAQYGIPATPQIRGDLAEIYVNGQKTNFSRNSVFPSFNGVEALDIVKGPGSAVYGPQGEGPGGYVNLVTKSPYLDHARTSVSATMGYWTSGHSNFNPEFQIDTGAPINSQLGYRVSYLSRYGDGYYLNQKNETQDIFGALTYSPSKSLRFDWWAQYYASRFNEVTGANRVTQDFIDHGTYIGGSVIAGPDPFGGGVVDGTSAVLDPSTAYRAKLPAYKALLGPEDTARSKRFQTQLISSLQVSDTFKIVNLTYYEDRTSKKFETYGYDEYVPRDQSLQNRLEFHNSFGHGLSVQLISGLDLRYTRLISYQDFTNEPFFFYDLNKDLSGVFYPGYYAQGKTWGSGLAVPGAAGYSGQVFFNSGGNQDTHIYDNAAFTQADISLTRQLSVVLGFRYDRISADTMSPNLVEVFDTESGTSFSPGLWLPKGTFFKAKANVDDPSYFASLTYKITDASSVYFTFNQINAITGSANFGGVNVGADFTATPATYHDELVASIKARSRLFEGGYKQSFLNKALYVSVAVFQQTRRRPQIAGPATEVKTNGIEAELVYQPTKRLTFNANMTYQDAKEKASFLYEQTGNYLDGYPVGFIVDGKSGTAKGSPNFGGFVPPTGEVKAAGVPSFLANAFLTYDIAYGFGVGAGPQIQGKQNANQEGTLTIPLQFEWDGFIYYRQREWDLQLSVKNFTNARLLDPIDVGFAGNDTVYVRPPISAALTFRYHF